MIVVSQCLLGDNCKYNGGNNYSQKVIDYLKNKEYIAVCPEQLGGLPTPRTPCECCGKRIINKDGEDKTQAFIDGAERCLKLIEDKEIECAILQPRSPSCGKGKIYDGSFTGTLTVGNGVFAQMLLERGIIVKHEDELD
ncbi:MAG: DUF523 domain-containing protein [Beduini sp.]|uniref:DUF523 domain-containing protein n=1 Tax=Beduini sp. TaxID=1922300 RepID=UPI00399F5FF3